MMKADMEQNGQRRSGSMFRGHRLAAHAARTIALLLVCALIGTTGAVFGIASCDPYDNAVYAAEGYEDIASKSETAAAVSVGVYGMTPVYGFDIEDGSYEIQTESSSTFFHIHETELIVKDGTMTANMTLSSTSYEYVYMGTPEEAAAAPLEDYIAPEDKDYRSTFTIPVEALDKEIDCAAFSKRKKKWYPRKILFDATSLPAQAVKISLPDYSRIEEALDYYDESNGTDSRQESEDAAKAAQALAQMDEGTVVVKPVDIDMPDGEYSIQVHMIGGSGRASVTTPTWLIVKDGKAYAKLLWSSTYYDYMIVGGRKYLNETTDGGNSTFTIPIAVMDEPMGIVADTTAMGDPVEIEYALTFYADTVDDKNLVPQEASIRVLVVALIIILVGGALNFIVKRKRKH